MLLLPAVLTFLCSTFVLGENNEYLMVELEPVSYERNLVKRQAQYAEPEHGEQPQQVQYVTPDQVSPEYYRYLQEQQYQDQPSADLNQVLSSRTLLLPWRPPKPRGQNRPSAPQSFTQQGPPRRAYIPEEVRRLQESFAQTQIREQEREDQTNQQLNSIGINPALVRRLRLRESAQRLAAQQARENAARQAAEQHYQQLVGPMHLVPPPQLAPVQQEIPAQSAESGPQNADRVSYSQVAFGTTKLPQQKLIPGQTQQFIYTHAQPQAQPTQAPPVVYSQQPQQVQVQPQEQQVTYQPQYVYTQERQRPAQPQQIVYVRQPVKPEPQPQFIYTPQPQRPAPVSYQPQQQQQVQYPQAEVTQKQHPDQYLIETTKRRPEEQQQVVTIPRRQPFSYRPQANYQELQAALVAQQQQEHIARQQEEASTTPTPRSSIFVTTSRTPTPKTYSIPEYRLSKQENRRPLTENELNALINAGFSVPSARSEEDYVQQYYSGLTKRQNTKPRIGRVPLSDQEREVLAKNGIRNLYRVQTAESQNSPVTYVLALDNQKRDTDKSTST